MPRQLTASAIERCEKLSRIYLRGPLNQGLNKQLISTDRLSISNNQCDMDSCQLVLIEFQLVIINLTRLDHNIKNRYDWDGIIAFTTATKMSKRKQSDIEDFFKKKPRAQISEVLLPENPQPQSSCATSTSCSGQRKSGIDANWKNEFPWMVTTTDGKIYFLSSFTEVMKF